MEKKRPRGLAAQKAAKKAKIEQDSDASNAQTVMLEQFVEEGDEVGEVAALYESAIEKSAKSNSAALQLLRGTINESDRILRNWDAEQRPPLRFYLTYGLALYELGRLSQDEDFEPYLDAAEERLLDGLDRVGDLGKKDENFAFACKIRVALSKIWIAKAAGMVQCADDPVPDLAAKALETLDQVLAERDNGLDSKAQVEVASIVQNHGELYGALEKQSKFSGWANKLLSKVLKDEPENISALSQLGLGALSLANSWLEKADTQQQSSTTPSEEEKHAIDALWKSKRYFEQALSLAEKGDNVHPHLHADLAEVILNLANLTTDDDQQQDMYQQAATHIQTAKSIAQKGAFEYVLPEGLQIFLDEWE